MTNYSAIKYSQNLIEKTKQVWQDESADMILDRDAIEIIDNTVALVELMAELGEKYGGAQQADI